MSGQDDPDRGTEPRADSTPDGADAERSLVDRVEDLVDEVLAEDLAPPEPPGPWERRQQRLDSWTAVLLALAAVATTWATFQATQWNEVQAEAQATSAILRSDANRAASDASSERVVDSQLWLSWLVAVANGQDNRATFYAERFSPALDRAQREWLALNPGATAQDPTTAPTGTPLDLPSYRPPGEIRSEALSQEAEDQLRQADTAAGTGTAFVLTSVVFALCLFFGSVATKFSRPKVQALLVLLAIALLAGGLLRVVTLPHSL
jgi:hypothetical protein